MRAAFLLAAVAAACVLALAQLPLHDAAAMGRTPKRSSRRAQQLTRNAQSTSAARAKAGKGARKASLAAATASVANAAHENSNPNELQLPQRLRRRQARRMETSSSSSDSESDDRHDVEMAEADGATTGPITAVGGAVAGAAAAAAVSVDAPTSVCMAGMPPVIAANTATAAAAAAAVAPEAAAAAAAPPPPPPPLPLPNLPPPAAAAVGGAAAAASAAAAVDAPLGTTTTTVFGVTQRVSNRVRARRTYGDEWDTAENEGADHNGRRVQPRRGVEHEQGGGGGGAAGASASAARGKGKGKGKGRTPNANNNNNNNAGSNNAGTGARPNLAPRPSAMHTLSRRGLDVPRARALAAEITPFRDALAFGRPVRSSLERAAVELHSSTFRIPLCALLDHWALEFDPGRFDERQCSHCLAFLFAGEPAGICCQHGTVGRYVPAQTNHNAVRTNANANPNNNNNNNNPLPTTGRWEGECPLQPQCPTLLRLAWGTPSAAEPDVRAFHENVRVMNQAMSLAGRSISITPGSGIGTRSFEMTGSGSYF